jgi:hypothetical protein
VAGLDLDVDMVVDLDGDGIDSQRDGAAALDS